MPESQYPARAVRAKANEVVEYHRDEEQPGKPLYLLIPGGLIAIASLLVIIWVAYLAWFDGSVSTSSGLIAIGLLAPVYVGGVFLFSYGYELYDVPKALRLTAIIVFITLAAVVIVAVLFAVLGALKGDKSSSSSSSSSGSSSSDSSSSGKSISRSSSSGGGSWGSALGPIFIDSGSSGTVTHEVTHEVVREVPVAPPLPQPVTCPYCGGSYIPANTKFACPNCGAATPVELLPPTDTSAK